MHNQVKYIAMSDLTETLETLNRPHAVYPDDWNFKIPILTSYSPNVPYRDKFTETARRWSFPDTRAVDSATLRENHKSVS